ncbi:MAG: AAA family ATPase [Desulfobacteraceae bacterium]|nr:MAG: AAA family ATPase [Desulfobacteraceae bacterium]
MPDQVRHDTSETIAVAGGTMDYFEILNLNKEPFSNSPDPDFFFQSAQHRDCLQKLEISIRLRRGLNVVVGEVGTGKTTLCRQLIRKFSEDPKIETYLMLDPHFPNPDDFLSAIDRMFHERSGASPSGPQYASHVKERIKQVLFQKGVDEGKTPVLIIDEGQKISAACLEMLRELLNYETNDHKLLQIIIFAQKEFEDVIANHENFTDRISLYHCLGPLDFRDTWRMIAFRLRQAGRDKTVRPVFSVWAFFAIYISTGGYPRKIINLCHQSLLAMIVQNRTKAGWFLIRSCAGRTMIGRPYARRRSLALGLAGLLVFSVALFGYAKGFHFRKGDVLEKQQEVRQKGETIIQAGVPAGTVKIGETAGAGDKTQAVQKKSGLIDKGVPEGNDFPRLLGQVAIRKGESLGVIAWSVYGRFDPAILKSILDANPHIANPDNIDSGKVINLPAVPAAVRNTGMPCWWVKLGETDNPEDAMEMIRSHPDENLPVRMIPYYSKASGLKFEIVAKEYFFDQDSAEKRVREIRTEDFPHAGIRSGWEGETCILFANPYLVYKNSARMNNG